MLAGDELEDIFWTDWIVPQAATGVCYVDITTLIYFSRGAWGPVEFS